nr:hypothetical protein [Plantibacter flavus]
MEVNAVAVSLSVPLVEHGLHSEKRLLRDEGLVPSAVQLALVADDARVVRVAEHLRHAALGDGPLRPLTGRSCPQPVFFHERAELRDRVMAGGVLLEGPRHKGCSLAVDLDGVDQVAVEVLPSVEVAELGPAHAAALGYLVSHLDGDVFTALAHLHLVHDVGDGFHSVAHVAVAELLLRRDETDSLSEQLSLGDGGIGEVTEEARAHVDDDVCGVGVFLDLLKETAEFRTFGDGLGRLTRLHELCDDGGAELDRLVAYPLALGGDTVAVLVNI